MSLRIAVNGKSLATPEPGGAVRVGREIVRHVARLDPDLRFEVFTPPARHGAPLPELGANVAWNVGAGIPLHSGTLRSLWEQAVLPLRVRRAGPFDVMLNPTNSAAVCLSPGAPQVLVVHDAGFVNAEWFRPSYARYVTTVVRLAARRDVVFTTVSRSSADQIAPLLPAGSRIRPVLVDADRPPPDLRPARASVPYLLFLGSLNPRKNPAGAIRGFLRFAEERTDDWQLWIAGAEKGIFRAAGLPELSDPRIRLLGYVSDRRRWEILAGARALVFPSFLEGFGLPVVEAMRVGTPVVAADLPVVRELFAGSVELVDPSSPASIAGGIRAVCRDDARRRELVERGYDVEARFSWESTAREYLELMTQLSTEDRHAAA